MKKIKFTILASILGIFILTTGCDNDVLADINVDPNSSPEINLEFLLARGTLRITNDAGMWIRSNHIYASNMIQHNADVSSFPQGDKYFYNPGYSAAMWDAYYGDAIKQLTNVVDNTEGDADRVNLYAMALTMRTYILFRLTDMYGDLPYQQAGRGLVGQQNWFPSYDTQDAIYGFIVDDLREARSLFTSSSNNIGNQDLLYGGNTVLWKKFINSLLLRVGMRLTKVDAARAQAIFEEAANDSNGLISSLEEDAYIVHTLGTGDNNNGISRPLSQSEQYANGLRPSATFMNWMETNNDPRLTIISGGTGDPFDESTWDTNEHIGLPNGLDGNTAPTWAINEGIIANETEYTINIVSFINPKIYDLDDPAYLLSYGEVRLNLAEAVLRGWNVPGTATEHFEAGVRAAINKWEEFDATLAVPAGDIDTYLAGIDFANATNQMELIGEQYWAAQYFDDIEAWYNWRRTGYPALTPVNYPTNETGGTIPRRMRYPESEISGNPDSYDAAIQNQGADLLTTRVWWDVP